MIDPDNIQRSIAGGMDKNNIQVDMHPADITVRFKDRPPTALRSRDDVQEYALFCAACAGKNSHQQAAKLQAFREELYEVIREWASDYMKPRVFNIKELGTATSLFEMMTFMDGYDFISEAIKRSKLGKWNLLAPGFKAMATDSDFPGKIGDRLAKVAKYSGYGIKTASLFNMHVFGEPCAVLDTYILKWLSGHAMFHDAPIDVRPPSYKGVPQQSINKWDVYQRWEDAFLSECYRRGMTALELDRQIWIHARIKTEKPKINQGELNYANS
jgi:hypothetical protein